MVKLTEKDICEITKRVAKRMVNESRFEISERPDIDNTPGAHRSFRGRFEIVSGNKRGTFSIIDRETREPLMDSEGNTEFDDISGGDSSRFQVDVPIYNDNGDVTSITTRNIPVDNPEMRGHEFGNLHPKTPKGGDWTKEKVPLDSDLSAIELGNPEHHSIEAYAGDPEENRKRVDDIVRRRRLERLKRDSMDI